MSNEMDILVIDEEIRKKFNEELNKLPEYQQKIAEIEDILSNEHLKPRIRSSLTQAKDNLNEHIETISSRQNYNFYLMESIPYIEQYKKLLKTPVKVSFLGKSSEDNKNKKKLIEQFLEVISKYMNIDIEKETKSQKISCPNCSNKKDFDIIDNNTYICTNCYSNQTVLRHNSSYNDIDRVNILSKYMYDPKIHFRDCIKQYQGKQNCTIPDKVYNDLEEQFERHHLLKGDRNTPRHIRFANITKNHICMFLKELDYPKHYENVHLIHYNFTGIKPEDISSLEDQLLDDFDVLIDLYHKRFKHIKRKNFINTQYVLYQLLCHHRYPCKKEEFLILKTIDRKFFHDDICKTLFEELGLFGPSSVKNTASLIYLQKIRQDSL